MTTNTDHPAFYTVAEAARVLRVDRATLYRAIREDAFPAVRIRSRYVVPGKAIQQMIDEATNSRQLVDLAAMVARRRDERELARVAPEWR